MNCCDCKHSLVAESYYDGQIVYCTILSRDVADTIKKCDTYDKHE